MKRHLKFGVVITLSLVLLSNPLLALASGNQKALLSKPTNAVSYSTNSHKNNKTFKSPVFPGNRTTRQSISPEGQTVTLLPDGRQLLIGGQGTDGPQSTAAIKDPGTNEIVPLATRLQHPRAWHSATLLPDGTILILGGIGTDGEVVDSAELFDPETLEFEVLPSSGLKARAYHTATLLTEGLALIVGGVSKDGKLEKKAQLFDPQGKTARTLAAALKTARYGHTATLLANGNVLLRGGADKNGKAIDSGETYDPAGQRFTKSDNEINSQSEIRNPELEASLPESPGLCVWKLSTPRR